MKIKAIISVSQAFPDTQVLEVKHKGDVVFACFCKAGKPLEEEDREKLFISILGAIAYNTATNCKSNVLADLASDGMNVMQSDAYQGFRASGLIPVYRWGE